MQVIKRLLLLLMITLLGFHFTSIAQQAKAELKDLTSGADVIITGKVTQQTSSWNEDKSRIYTLATVQVDEYLKGNSSGNTVTIKYLGGEVEDIGEIYSHMPRLEDKEEVLLFLKKDNKTTDYKVYDGENGKIRIVQDPKTGEKITTSNVRINSLKSQIKTISKE